MFSFRSFTFSGITFKSLIHFELIFVSGVSQGSCFILLHVNIQLSWYHFLKRLSFLYWVFLAPLSYISLPYMLGFISGILILFPFFGLFLYQYHTVLMIIALQYNLKSGSVMPPALFFSLRISLAIRGLLWFHINFRSVFSTSVNSVIGILTGMH